jgi:hypothetical protein
VLLFWFLTTGRTVQLNVTGQHHQLLLH